MKIIVAPDKFKGSLSSFDVCRAINDGIKAMNKQTEVLLYPMADGGDGFAAVMKYYRHTETIVCNTVDPLGRSITASYEWHEKRQAAIIEMAVASGLVLLNKEERDPLLASTFGTGLMIMDAIGKGATNIILGLGGSATNDAGTGILSAMGFGFLNDKSEYLQGNGKALAEIKKIVRPALLPPIKFEIACDVQNIMHGKEGAAFVFGPQKGADDHAVSLLDAGLKNFAQVLKNETGTDISGVPGSGAAGAIAVGLMSFFDVEMKKGIELIIDASMLKNELQDAGLVITGEGRIDAQSGTGKVVGYLSSLAAQYNIPCHAVCGELDLDEKGVRELGLRKVLALQDHAASKKEAIENAQELLVKFAAGITDL